MNGKEVTSKLTTPSKGSGNIILEKDEQELTDATAGDSKDTLGKTCSYTQENGLEDHSAHEHKKGSRKASAMDDVMDLMEPCKRQGSASTNSATLFPDGVSE